MPESTRHTNQRQAVLRIVKISPQPLKPGDVYTAVRQRNPAISRATVYRSLSWLTKRGEVYPVDNEDGVRCFVGHAYHRLTATCQRCGQTWTQSEQTLPKFIRHQLAELPMVFFSTISVGGLCRDCLAELKPVIAHL